MVINVKEKKPAKTESIRQSVFIEAPPEKVYEAFVNPRIHSRFTGSPATGEAKVGSRITAWDGYISGKNLKLTKGKLIVQEWRDTDFPEGHKSSQLKLTFKKKGKGTQLTMVHSKIPAGRSKDLGDGWAEYYWKPLKKYFKDIE